MQSLRRTSPQTSQNGSGFRGAERPLAALPHGTPLISHLPLIKWHP